MCQHGKIKGKYLFLAPALGATLVWLLTLDGANTLVHELSAAAALLLFAGAGLRSSGSRETGRETGRETEDENLGDGDRNGSDALIESLGRYIETVSLHVRNEINRVCGLTNEAIEELTLNFTEMQQSATRLADIAAGTIVPVDKNEADHIIRAINADIHAAAGRAIRNLQYQDIVHQILVANDQILERLEYLGRHSLEAISNRTGSPTLEIERARRDLEKQLLDADRHRHRPATQSTMEAGEVEMF